MGRAARVVRPRVRALSNVNSTCVAATTLQRWRGLPAGDNLVVLDVCWRVGRAWRALSTAVGLVARHGVGVVGCPCFFLFSTLGACRACALCGVRRRLSASRRHLTAHGWCCCDAFGLTALAAYAGRAARLGQICGCAPFQMTSASEWPPIRRRRLSA